MHVAVDAPEEGEIRVERRDAVREGVIDLDCDDVVRADIEVGRRVENKGCEPSSMVAKSIAVDVDDRNDVRSVEFEEQPPSRFVRADQIVPAIPTNPAIIITAAVLSVEVVPGVWQIHQRPPGIVEAVGLRAGDSICGKPPARVEIDVFARIDWRRIRLTQNSRGRNSKCRREKEKEES